MADRRETLTLQVFRGKACLDEFTVFCDPDDGKELARLLRDAVVTRMRLPETRIPEHRMQIRNKHGRQIRPDFVTTGK